MLGLIIRILLFIALGFTIKEIFALGSAEMVISTLVQEQGGAKAVQERLEESSAVDKEVFQIRNEMDFIKLLSQSKAQNRTVIVSITVPQKKDKSMSDKIVDMYNSLSKLAADKECGQLFYAVMNVVKGSPNASILDRILQSADLKKDQIAFPLTLTLVGERLKLPINPGYLTYDYLRAIALKSIGK